jgi:hypothetical protein
VAGDPKQLARLARREVLAGRKSVDIDSAVTAIRYPLRWHHVALVVQYTAATGEANGGSICTPPC